MDRIKNFNRKSVGRRGQRSDPVSVERSDYSSALPSIDSVNQEAIYSIFPNQVKRKEWTNNKSAQTKAGKLPGKLSRSKLRWKKIETLKDCEDDDFFDFESDLSAALHTLKVSSGLTSPKKILNKANADNFANDDVTEFNVGSAVANTAIPATALNFGLSGDIHLECYEDDNVDLEGLAAPIPLRKSRSFRISQTLEDISTSLYHVLFRPDEVMGSGLARSAASQQLALAWDAADDEDGEESDEDGDNPSSGGSCGSDDTCVIELNGESIVVPRIPRIEPVNSAWLREQLASHADYYRNALDYDNPLLSARGTGPDIATRFINGRFIHSLMDVIREEDGRFSSPRVALLQGLYRFGTGRGVNHIRERIAHCLAEVALDHYAEVQKTVCVMRAASIDPDTNRKGGPFRSLQVYYTRDRGYAQLLELLEFAVLCENREILLKIYGNRGEDDNVRQLLPPIAYPLKMPLDDKNSAEIRLQLLLMVVCRTLQTLPSHEFLDNTASTSRDDAGRGGPESEQSLLLAHLLEKILTLANALSVECSARASILALRLLVKAWPNGQQCNVAMAYVRAAEVALRFTDPTTTTPTCSYSPAPPHGSSQASVAAFLFPGLGSINGRSISANAATLSLHIHPRYLVSKCIQKLLQAVNSHHAKVAELAISVIDSNRLHYLLLKQERDSLQSTSRNGGAGTVSTKECNEIQLSVGFANTLPSQAEITNLAKLVSILRENRNNHWHPQVQRSSAGLLEKITAIMLEEEEEGVGTIL